MTIQAKWLPADPERGGDAVVFIRCMSKELYRKKLKPLLSSDGDLELSEYIAGSSHSGQEAWDSLNGKDQKQIKKFIEWAKRFRWEWSLVRCERKENE